MNNVFERLTDWVKQSLSSEGIVLTDETKELVTWLSKAQRRPAEVVVNDLLSAVLEKQRRNRARLPRWIRLTQREQEVAVLVIKGYSNSQIARTLGISMETVRSHIHHMNVKYGVQGKIRLRERLTAEQAGPDS
jgi:DNA-binding CsgD family transcriptional regulator